MCDWEVVLSDYRFIGSYSQINVNPRPTAVSNLIFSNHINQHLKVKKQATNDASF